MFALLSAGILLVGLKLVGLNLNSLALPVGGESSMIKIMLNCLFSPGCGRAVSKKHAQNLGWVLPSSKQRVSQNLQYLCLIYFYFLLHRNFMLKSLPSFSVFIFFSLSKKNFQPIHFYEESLLLPAAVFEFSLSLQMKLKMQRN